jgi:hypothetical protein
VQVTLGPKIPSLIKALVVWAIKTVVGDETFASAFGQYSRKVSLRCDYNLQKRRNVRTSGNSGNGRIDVMSGPRLSTGWYVCQWETTLKLGMGREQVRYDRLPCASYPRVEARRDGVPFASIVSGFIQGDRYARLTDRLSTIMYNICDSTVGVLPVVRVDKEQDAVSSASGTNESGSKDLPRSKLLEKRVYHPETGVYDEQAMHGLPVGVQIVGRAYEEEKVLAMMKIVEELVKYE